MFNCWTPILLSSLQLGLGSVCVGLISASDLSFTLLKTYRNLVHEVCKVYIVHTSCTRTRTVYTVHTYTVYKLYVKCTHFLYSVHTLCTVYTLYVQCTLHVQSITLHVQCAHFMYSVHTWFTAYCVHTLCTV